MWYLNKVWSTNFVDEWNTCGRKMILLANIFISLEIINGNQIQLKNLEIFVCQQLDTAIFSNLLWEIGLRSGVVL